MATDLKRLTFRYTLLLLAVLTLGLKSVNAQSSAKALKKRNRAALKKLGMVYVPPGLHMTGFSDSDLPYLYTSPYRMEDPRTGRRFEVDSFYLHQFEVTNEEYLAYIQHFKPEDSLLMKAALPDTMCWRKQWPSFEFRNDYFLDLYLRHPAYRSYPVVGVTHQQAIAFCQWRTTIYNQNPEREFEKVRFRLPTRIEWEHASCAAGRHNPNGYPWDGYYSIDSEGQPKANFRMVAQGNVITDTVQTLNFRGDTVTTLQMKVIGTGGFHQDPESKGLLPREPYGPKPVESYAPNALGLYQMAGNVEEFVAEYSVTKGGSWSDPGFYLQAWIDMRYNPDTEVNAKRGFRLAMDILEE